MELAIAFKPQNKTDDKIEEENIDVELEEAPEVEENPSPHDERDQTILNMKKQMEILQVSLASIQKEYTVLKDGKKSMEVELKK